VVAALTRVLERGDGATWADAAAGVAA
jgi:hypothetical protein